MKVLKMTGSQAKYPTTCDVVKSVVHKSITC